MLKAAVSAAFSVLLTCVAVAVCVPVAHAADASSSAQSRAKQKPDPKAKAKGKARSNAKRAESKKGPKANVESTAPRAERGRKTGMQRVSYAPAAAGLAPTVGDLAGLHKVRDPLDLKSNVALVMDQGSGEVLFEKNAHVPLPIASITKLMTGLVVVDTNQNMDEILTVTEADVDREKFSHSRLRVGSQLSRADMLHIALMSSENRAASALGRHFPGGLNAFVAAMNAKARQLGMTSTRFVDSTGLSSGNVSSGSDLAKLVSVSYQQPVLRQYSTNPKHVVEPGGAPLHYRNSNHLVDVSGWEIGLQKTGFISEAGRCLVMQARIDGRPVVMVFLDSKGKLSRTADAGRVRRWIETSRPSASTPMAIRQGSA